MKAVISPGRADGAVSMPSSKSISHRAIIGACLADGVSRISNISISEDIEATIRCMEMLGAGIERREDDIIINGGKIIHPKQELFCGESGSTLRFLIPLAAMLGEPVVFTGGGRLLSRPQDVYEKIWKKREWNFEHTENRITVGGPLTGGKFKIRGDVSSQFITGLMISLPMMEKDSIIEIVPPYESHSYVNMTISLLEKFGIKIDATNEMAIKIKGRQKYSPASFSVEGDESHGAFFAGIGALNGNVTCVGLDDRSEQGDRVMRNFLTSMGADIVNISGGFTAKKSKLYGDKFDLSDCPDLGPILMVCTAFAGSPSKITGIKRLRIKESDRIESMVQELTKLGAEIGVAEDELRVIPHAPYIGGINISGHGDHRVVMSMAVAASLCEKACVIHGCEAVNKSYPNFFEDLSSLGISVQLENE